EMVQATLNEWDFNMQHAIKYKTIQYKSPSSLRLFVEHRNGEFILESRFDTCTFWSIDQEDQALFNIIDTICNKLELDSQYFSIEEITVQFGARQEQVLENSAPMWAVLDKDKTPIAWDFPTQEEAIQSITEDLGSSEHAVFIIAKQLTVY